MLQAMRDNTRIILWVTIIAFVLLIFLVWGADLNLGSGPQPGSIGLVNGEPVPVVAYQQLIAQNRQVATSQGVDLQPSDYLRIEEESWDAVVEEMLLLQEAERQGIEVHDSEVRTILLNDPPAAIQQNPGFQNETGQFDLNLYRASLQSAPRDQLLALEGLVRANLPLQKLQRTVVSAAKVTEDEVRRSWLETNEKSKVSWVLVSLPNISGSDPSDEELAAWFADNSDRFTLPKRADINYVTIPRRASAADTLTLVEDLHSFRREAITAAQSLAAGNENLSVSDFETLAMTFSDAPSADQGGLSAGFMTPSEMTPAMRRAVQELGVDDISEPFLDGGFYHIVQVVAEKTETPEGSESPVRQVQIRDLALRVGPSDSTMAENRAQLDELKRVADLEGLAAAAAQHGLTVQTAGNVTGSGLAPGLSSIPNLAAFALRNPEGTVSRVFETNTGWFVLEIAAVKEAGIPSFEEVRNRVTFEAKRDRQYDLAKRLADQISGRIKMGATLEDAAAQDSLVVNASPEFSRRLGIPSLSREPEPGVVGAAFALPVGQVSEPLRTSAGWVILRVDERPELDEEQYTQQAPIIRQSLIRTKQNQLYQGWIEELRSKAEIIDYRS